jgi:hypothetical protein
LSLERLAVKVTGPVTVDLPPVELNRDPATGELKAAWLWSWDTTDAPPGSYILEFTTSPDPVQWTERLELQPSTEMSPLEQQARWAVKKTACCEIHYITGTAAERDLDMLSRMADEEARSVSSQLQAEFNEPVQITFLSRVLGHGGFASEGIGLSYLDRNYAGSTVRQVMHHEMVHVLDGQLGGELRPTMLLEGLAVYLSGGHFKPEALIPRAAELVDMGMYLPFRKLTGDFYAAQHETGYLEAAALIEYLVQRWGWQAFSDFYRDIHPVEEGKDSNGGHYPAIDAALQKHYQISFYDLEIQFLGELERQPENPNLRRDVAVTIQFYETVRRYQQLLDSSAYFRQFWMPSGKEMREKGVVADYLRHPDEPVNQSLETWLAAAEAYLRQGQFDPAEQAIEMVNQSLDEQEQVQAFVRLFQPEPIRLIISATGNSNQENR